MSYPSGPQQPYGDQPHGQQPPYGDPHQPYGGQQPPYGDQPHGHQPPYGDPNQPYGGQQPPYGPPPTPPKQGMSTGKKVGFGCGGCLGVLLFLALIGGCMSLVSGDDAAAPPAATSSPDTEEAAVEETEEAEEEPAEEVTDVVLTASLAGTAGDVVDDTVYTVIDVTVENNSDDTLEVNPLYFNVILADGTVRSDWADTLFADIDKLSTVSLGPGQRVEGQIAVVGDDLDIATVEMAELFGLQETITAEVS
ncbi:MULTISPECIES: DUF4352 domain-containing protein [Nocardiopsis]|uniref:DUF4352 domain-containing protein n=1 Tax=Nocardiopsis TaxID=2013 RepID=UPI0003459E51|nr:MULTISPECIES: DUF4352 domain-containing protein [Nocardiopsis]PWV45062.1 uncharacterized protein DUF4352 [Nocardiopsis sp. L17-MgMaSL7]